MTQGVNLVNNNKTSSNIVPKTESSSSVKPTAVKEEEKEEKKPKKFTKTAFVTAALGLAAAGACLYKTGKIKSVAEALGQTLQKTQDELIKTQNSLSSLQKKQSNLVNKLLFPNGVENINFKQGNIGDCYLLSSIYGLSRNPKGQDILKNMVTITDEGNFLVKFKNQAPITIYPNQLKGDITNGSVKNTAYGDFGLQAIECAYGKYRKGLVINNRNLSPLEAIDKGKSSDALKVLGGLKSKVHGDSRKGSFCSQKTNISNILDKIADNFNDRIICVSTPCEKFAVAQEIKNGKSIGFMDINKKFNCSHAYTVVGIDKTNKTVKVVNPYDTLKEYTLSYNEFSNIFSNVFEAKI